jgi:hypothetical protein
MNNQCSVNATLVTITVLYTVGKAKRDAGPQHMGDVKFRRPHRQRALIYVVGGFYRSFYVDDGIFRHPCVSVLRHARLF